MRFELPPPDRLGDRLAAVRQVLYLVFNEGTRRRPDRKLHRVDLTAEAIRLARQLHARRPDDAETAGLLALMLLTDARRPSRSGPDGSLVPLAGQDRTRWDPAAIAEGTRLVEVGLAAGEVGPFLLQAAIAAVHDEAATAADTDWAQVLILYDLLATVAPGPMVTLGRIVALSMGGWSRGGPGRAGRGRTRAGRPPPAARGPGPSAGGDRGPGRGAGGVRAGRPPHAQRARAAIPVGPGRLTGGAP